MRRRVALIIVSTAVLWSCGLPSDESFQQISREDRYGLSQTTVATTTTSVAPTTTIDATTTTAAMTTSTLVTELVDLYFITGRQLTSVTTPLPLDPALSQVIAALEKGPPPGGLGTGLRTAIPTTAEITVVSEAGIATVDLPASIFDGLDAADQRLLLGQVVLTLTDRPGVGPVVFTLAGEPTRVFRGDASLTEPGQPVSRDDYLVLLTGGATVESAADTPDTDPSATPATDAATPAP